MLLLPAFTGENHIYHTDALSLLRSLGDKSVDAFITDLPYGTTACSWDEIIPFAPMWAEVKRTLKPRGVFVTTASQPFTSKLVMSNVGMFHQELVWDKVLAGGFLDAARKHMKQHENILVFCDGLPTYNPQMIMGLPYKKTVRGNQQPETMGGFLRVPKESDGYRFPKSILKFSNGDQTDKQHPTQKPVALYEYMISTYTQPNDLVVDFCCGSGTTALAARNLGRQFIGGDITPEYVEVARKRLAEAYTPLMPIFLEQQTA